MLFNNSVRIILHKPSHPGNIGAVARAMKTMGLSALYLVAPKKFPDPKATALATHAEDILLNANIFPDLLSAIKDVHVVYATSANTRDVNLPVKSARDAAIEMIKQSNQQTIAIVFGPENHGLSNHDLLHAHHLIQIPTAPDYHSLNLAQAVQIIVYELFMASADFGPEIANRTRPASVAHLEFFYQQLEKTCVQLQLLNPKKPRQLMQRLRRLFNRAHLDEIEVNLINAILNGKKIH